MLGYCKGTACSAPVPDGVLFCNVCQQRNDALIRVSSHAAYQLISDNDKLVNKVLGITSSGNEFKTARRESDIPMSVRYPKYYKPVPEGMKDLDIYSVCKIFEVVDPSGALHHAIKKILLPGIRTGGKSRFDDIKEARDTLSRWLELYK